MPLPKFGTGKPYPPPLPDKEEFIVSALLAFMKFNPTFTSSIFSANSIESAKFNVSTEVDTLGMSLYVFGFAFGPTLFSPLSELFHRRLPILIGVLGISKPPSSAGFFGACPIAVVAAVFSDIYDNRHRGLAVTIFTMMGFIVDSYLGWRWTEYLTGILGAAAFVLDLFFVQETYPPVNWDIHAKQEENFSRPVRILFSEPVLLLLSIYMAFLYGLLYLFMTAYPIVFQQIHGFNKAVGGLPYFGLIIGEFCGGLSIIAMQPWYTETTMIGGMTFAAGLFWFGWTGYTDSIHWIVPTVSGLLTGFGLLCIFLQCLNYIVNTYLYPPSMAGAGFPLFAPYMFNAIGVNWTGTLLGCVAAVLTPIPLLFYLYGYKIRSKSKFAAEYTAVAKANTAAEE
ncbi:major facilitator superfamily domain-containing protein [Aspergillus fruticulosus]